MAQSVSLSSIGTAAMALNPVAKTTTLILTGLTAASTGTVQIDISLDDPSIVGGPTATWATASSGAAMLSSNVTTLVYSILSPVAQARIQSSAINNTWTLKALQSVVA